MFKLNSYNKKIFILLIGSFLFFLISYRIGFKKTIGEYFVYKKNSSQLESIKNAPTQLDSLMKLLQEFNLNIIDNSTLSDNFQVLLLEKSTGLLKKNDVLITGIQKMNMDQSNDINIKTQEIVYQGGFLELLKFLSKLSEDKDIGKICSVEFYNQKNLRTRNQVLKMKIIFQIITSNS